MQSGLLSSLVSFTLDDPNIIVTGGGGGGEGGLTLVITSHQPD